MSAEEKSKLLQKVDAQLARKPSGDEEDECVIKGNSVALSAFYRIARNTLSVWFPTVKSTAADVAVDPAQVNIAKPQPDFFVVNTIVLHRSKLSTGSLSLRELLIYVFIVGILILVRLAMGFPAIKLHAILGTLKVSATL